jgi:hypothetical protein
MADPLWVTRRVGHCGRAALGNPEQRESVETDGVSHSFQIAQARFY